MKKVVVIGALGMAGHIMVAHLGGSGEYEVLGIARSPGEFIDEILDVTDFPRLESYLEKIKPEYVINCVGALVSHATENISSAILLNSYLPHFLSQTGNKLHYKLIHISTDCVFSGKDGQYTETSFRDGDNNYARTMELAKAVEWAIESDISGLYHVTNGKPINKYDLLMLFKKYTKRNIQIEAVSGRATDKSLLDTRKKRGDKIPDYDVMVHDMVSFMKGNSELYAHYKLGD